MEHYRINKVWVDDALVWAETTTGWKANYPLTVGVVWQRLQRNSARGSFLGVMEFIGLN